MRITELDPLNATPGANDELAVVDTSDTGQSAEGSTKRVTASDLLAGHLPFAGGQMSGPLDMGGAQLYGNTVLVTQGEQGTLTNSRTGRVIVTSGNVTIPPTTGFHVTIVAGGAHTVSFNGTTSPAMATGDVMSVFVESAFTIHASLVTVANKVAFS